MNIQVQIDFPSGKMRDMSLVNIHHDYVLVLFLVILLSSFMKVQLCGADQQLSNHHHGHKQDTSSVKVVVDMNIGVIVDMGSSINKVVLDCINMATKDYTLNGTTSANIILHTEDSKGDPFTAITIAKHLIQVMKVEALIVIPEMTSEASIMATFGDQANVPILSFTNSFPTSHHHPYFLQITEDKNTTFEPIFALVEKFNWSSIVIIHEADTNDHILPQLEEFRQRSIQVVYRDALDMITDDQGLHKLKMMQTSVFIIHTSPSLASKIFINSKRLGMMTKGYVWLVTSKTMNFFDSLDPLVLESMEGALGFKSYVPPSTNLQNFTSRWSSRRSEVEFINQEQRSNLNVLGLRAYDTISALGKATSSLSLADRTKVTNYGSKFLSEISKNEFSGLSGDFRITNGKLIVKGYEVVNVIGKRHRQVGFWTSHNNKFAKDINNSEDDDDPGLETIIWPGLSTDIPKGWWFGVSGKWLKIGYPPSGFKEFINTQHVNNETIVSGFCKDVFDAAIKNLGYDVPYKLIGIPYTNASSYSDLIRQVYEKQYDGAIGDISITSTRSEYVDFTMPYTDLGLSTVVRLDRRRDIWFFLQPFDTDMWITVACFFVLVAVIIWLFEHRINEEFQGSRAHQIGTSLWFSISTLVYAHREELRCNLSKFVIGVWLFVVFILASSYTAILSSILTVEQIQYAKGDYIGHVIGSHTQGTIVDNFNVADDKLRPYKSLEDFNDALSKGSKNGGVSAIIDETPYIKMFLAKYPHDHVMTDTSFTTNGIGFAFQKGSPLVSEISRAIAKLRQDGELARLEDKWFYQVNSESYRRDEQIKPETLSLDNFLGLFFVTGISKFIALFLFLIFFLRQRLFSNQHILKYLMEGRLGFIMKYLFPRMPNIIGGVLPR